MHSGIERILQLLPDSYQPFEGTEYPMPVAAAMLAAMPEYRGIEGLVNSRSVR